MGNTLSIRISEEQRAWLREKSELLGKPVGEIVREQIDKARLDRSEKPWMKLSGILEGLPPDLSSRKGYGRK